MTAVTSFEHLLGSRCLTAPEQRARYETPERGGPGQTPCVLLPGSEHEVRAVLELCNRAPYAVVLCGGRTGLVEAQRPLGEAVLSLERLNRPLQLVLAGGQSFDFATVSAVDAQAWGDALGAWWRGLGMPPVAGATISVQAGLAVDTLNAVLAPLGLMFPMEMGSSAAATVGACAANASAGANALCYGTAAHMTRAAWGFWGDASHAGPCSAEPWELPDPQQLAVDSARIRPSWGLLGTQGVLGVITRLSLQLFEIPQQREAALIPAADMPEAMRILAAARERFGDAIEEFEFISRAALALVRELRGDAFRLPFAEDPDAPLLLLMQIKSPSAGDDLAGALYDFLSEDLGLADEQIGYGPIKALKAIRHSITEASNARMRMLGGGRLSFDTAAPLARFGDYLDALQRELRAMAPQVELVAFGHAGVGGAHLHLLGTREAPVGPHAEALVDCVFDVTLAYGGTFSAEHGIGPKWADAYLERTPAAQLDQLRSLKRRFDPRNVLNPRSFGLDRLLRRV